MDNGQLPFFKRKGHGWRTLFATVRIEPRKGALRPMHPRDRDFLASSIYEEVLNQIKQLIIKQI